MGPERRSTARGVKADKTAVKPSGAKRVDEPAVPADYQRTKKGRDAAHLARIKELKAAWPMLMMLTALAGDDWQGSCHADFMLLELHYKCATYEIDLPFEWVAALDKDEERVMAIHHHWERMKAWQSQRTTEQSRDRRKQQLLAGMSDDDKDILGIKE